MFMNIVVLSNRKAMLGKRGMVTVDTFDVTNGQS